MTDDDVKLETEALQAAQQIVDAIARIKGKKLAIAFRDEATAQRVGMIIENAAKVSRALLNRPNSSSPDGRMNAPSPEVVEAVARVLNCEVPGMTGAFTTGDIRDFQKEWNDHRHEHFKRIAAAAITAYRRAQQADAAVAEQGPPSNGGTPNSPDGRMREATIEECAKVAATLPNPHRNDYARGFHDACVQVCDAIRSLSPNSEPVHNPNSPKPEMNQ